MSIKRLRDLIFGRHTEKRKAPSGGKEEEKPEGDGAIDPVTESKRSERSQREGKAAAKGHGRRAAQQYSGAKRVACRHEQYKAGESCPDRYCQGRLYNTKKPNIFIQFSGQPILEGLKAVKSFVDKFTHS
jgi:hypothetical protein